MKTNEQDMMSLTTSNDCPCYGGFACRRGDGACEILAKQWAGAGEERATTEGHEETTGSGVGEIGSMRTDVHE